MGFQLMGVLAVEEALEGNNGMVQSILKMMYYERKCDVMVEGWMRRAHEIIFHPAIHKKKLTNLVGALQAGFHEGQELASGVGALLA